MAKSFLLLCLLLGVSIAKEITRSKRQMNVYYMCGNYPNSYVSQYPCVGSSNGCGYSSCNGFSTAGILPNSFYSPYSNCNSGCGNVNCNQYNGMYVNGQYVAYSYGSNQYSSCASSCCNGYNNYNNFNNNFNGYNPYLTMGPGPVIGTGVGVNGATIGSGAIPTGSVVGGIGINNLAVSTCGGKSAVDYNGICNNGYCSDGYVCTQGNNCCLCSVGSSNGRCSPGVACAAGYSCMQNGYCCASSPWQLAGQLQSCVNNICPANFNCGDGNLCYPSGK